MKGSSWPFDVIRLSIALGLCTAAGIKVMTGHLEGGVVSRELHWISIACEAVCGLGAAATRRTWPVWGACAFAVGALVFFGLHRHDPRPCGCLGSMAAPGPLRVWYLGWLGAAGSIYLGARSSHTS